MSRVLLCDSCQTEIERRADKITVRLRAYEPTGYQSFDGGHVVQSERQIMGESITLHRTCFDARHFAAIWTTYVLSLRAANA